MDSSEGTNTAGDDLGSLFGEEAVSGSETSKSNTSTEDNTQQADEADESKEIFEDNSSSTANVVLKISKDTDGLFGEGFSFEEEKPSSEALATDDLRNLFGTEKSVEEEPTPEALATEDISDLFGEEFSFEAEKSSLETAAEDISDLFGEEFSFEAEKSSLEIAAEDISDLFGEEFSFEVSQQEATKLLYLYEQFSELETLLEQPAELSAVELNGAGMFEQLEALLDSPAMAEPAQFKQEQQTANLSPSALSSTSPYPEEKINLNADDDEFGDLEDLLEEADRTMGGPPSNKSTGARAPKSRQQKGKVFEQTMRVPVKQLDNLGNLMGELVVNRNSLEQDQERLRQFLDNLLNQVQQLGDVGGRMQDLYERSLLESSLLASRNHYHYGSSHGGSSSANGNKDNPDYDPLEMDRFTGFHLLSQEMIELIVRVRESSSDIQFLVDETEQVARNLRQVTTQLQEGLTKSRMVPFAQTADRLPRAVRDISLKLKKQAKLQVEGREALIDKMILEHLYDPMTHLVNNAITHGIESPQVRQQKGKPPAGKITISAFLQGNQTVISVADDGAGIDPQRVKSKAIEKGLIGEAESKTLTDKDIYDFLFHPGFSTKDKADDFAGRGVGMDVVATALSTIRGTISIDSVLGKGTTFNIRLPLTLSICKALCCLSHHARIAFPMDGVEDMQDYTPNDIQTNSEGKQCVRWRDTLLTFQPLSNLLKYNRKISRGSVYGGKQEEDKISIVVLRSAGSFLAIQVDQVLGEQEIVIKQIEGPVPKPPGIAGATVLGDGHIMAIADVLELIEIAQGRMRTDHHDAFWEKTAKALEKEIASVKSEPMVLIIDDSITVRELLSMTFNKSGYRVEQARDGQEAWEKLRSGLPCDLVFCDVEMPRMDGLELLSRIQKDEQLSPIPVAMLTSRGAERHRQVAAELGASGYFTKPYLEDVLLEAAHEMINGKVLLPNSTRKTAQPQPQPQPQSQPQSPSQPQSQPKKVTPRQFVKHETLPPSPKLLIIDDSVTVRELLSMTFKNAGYSVEQARDGQDAWEKLNNEDFDLVFCDIEMPRMDGLELLIHLQKDERLREVPVAMLTSRGAERHRKIAAERGARGYFTKPYLEEFLLDAANRLIKGEVLLNNNGQVEIL
ncbi:MAG: hybrid sensor histidine kinase/response regulator [Moorea sp. SIO2B7]|nr:hybrid sensor histidine kinase/response regulator [Moorena sp. SIO2B7]